LVILGKVEEEKSMTLPSPNLDDLRFQRDLVDEARKRIVQYCPEWTDYNLSDPGITLIELFAWMTELMVYRLNRVPEKNYIKFLDLLGLKRRAASSARTDLTFWLSTALPFNSGGQQTVRIPKGTEVRSNGLADEEVTFSTDRDLTIISPVLTQLRRSAEINKNFLTRLGVETFYPFDKRKPKNGDVFYIGFDPEGDIRGHILQLRFECDPTEAVGIRREDPPWKWEVSMGNGEWRTLSISTLEGEKDSTGGLNNPRGRMVFYLPLDIQPDQVHGRMAFWLRCSLAQRDASQGMYAESPRVTKLEAYATGASVPATHAIVVQKEYLGRSNGESGQQFQLEFTPVLSLSEGEHLLVEEVRSGEIVPVPWTYVKDFSHSSRYDRHFTIDPATGTISLGLSVRQPDGSVLQYGRIPENGRAILFSRYRYGGGAAGNLPANTLQIPTTSLAYVARVNNLQRSSGGQDQESMDEVKLRAQRELQAQKRAVTAQDFEQVVQEYSRSIARVKCLTPQKDDPNARKGVVELLVVPAVADSLQVNDLSRLHLGSDFIRDIEKHLDGYRLLTTTVKVREPEYVGVRVVARVVLEEFVNREQVISRIHQHLQNYLNPLLPFPDLEQRENVGQSGLTGWVFGRNLFSAEIFALIQRVSGVKYVLNSDLYHRPVVPRLEMNMDKDENNGQDLKKLKSNVLLLDDNALICSLDHQIEIADISEMYE
jgi:predicted phage baseplate assembly protein